MYTIVALSYLQTQGLKKKCIEYVYIEIFVMCLVILVLIYGLLLCFRYSCEKLAQQVIDIASAVSTMVDNIRKENNQHKYV